MIKLNKKIVGNQLFSISNFQNTQNRPLNSLKLKQKLTQASSPSKADIIWTNISKKLSGLSRIPDTRLVKHDLCALGE